MNFNVDDLAHTTFLTLRRSLDDADAAVVISRAAMHLHTFGVLSSIEAGTPGFICDRYLDSVSAQTSLTALELRLAGLWERVDGGYRVSDADTLAVARQIHGQLHDMARRCERDGGHRVSPDRRRDAATCTRCGAPTSAPSLPHVDAG